MISVVSSRSWSVVRLLVALVLLTSNAGAARALGPEGTWIISDRVVVDIFGCDSALCGRVVWLRNPRLRTAKMCGRTIIWGLTPSGPEQWTDGSLFDPEDGSTYSLSAVLQRDGTISARVYEGFSLFGRTELLRRIEPYSLSGWC
jgi:uncharacterized protein (DUF2147 family)